MRLPQKGAMNITKNLGMLLLAIYLILVGIIALVHIAIPVLDRNFGACGRHFDFNRQIAGRSLARIARSFAANGWQRTAFTGCRQRER